MAITDVKTDSSWIIVIGDSGKEIKRISKKFHISQENAGRIIRGKFYI